ncbi:hypothetical protein HJG53_12810 [Sphingomonas sp. ID1715]|uniref:PepSY domain-containing protein n=1 Tax=Sphingomonas sp. ID1715 TaxID=1656898 RepID=UPI00148795B9|nr:PepSY domain-containing protein [Sphingomonas sp. ID1715]NNM77789.1 hypothetical protein [Sphingomonas sp. ID1715]
MRRLRISPLLFRRIHKWVGLILGLQFVLWTLSGSMMALLDMEAVGGHAMPAAQNFPLSGETEWVPPAVVARRDAVAGLTLRNLAGRPVYELSTTNGVRLVDAGTGAPVAVDARIARAVAAAANHSSVRAVAFLAEPNLEAREHAGAMWRVDFADAANSSAYVSAETGRFLVMRGDSWRTWDFFWMLHNMDYLNRTSFNHPLIIFVAFGVLWLSGTGFYLLFKSFRRGDFRWITRPKPSQPVRQQSV